MSISSFLEIPATPEQKHQTAGGRISRKKPQLSIRTPSLIDPGRLYMSTRDVIVRFFDSLATFLGEHDLIDKPHRLFYIYKSWLSPLDEKQTKVVVPSECEMPYKVFGGSKEHITFAMCACAYGH